jgi:hypothetical protein
MWLRMLCPCTFAVCFWRWMISLKLHGDIWTGTCENFFLNNCNTKCQVMKAYEGVKVWQVHTFLTQELWKWPVRFAQEAGLEPEPVNASEKGQIFCPCQGLNLDPTFQPVAHLRYQVSYRKSRNWCSNVDEPDLYMLVSSMWTVALIYTVGTHSTGLYCGGIMEWIFWSTFWVQWPVSEWSHIISTWNSWSVQCATIFRTEEWVWLIGLLWTFKNDPSSLCEWGTWVPLCLLCD